MSQHDINAFQNNLNVVGIKTHFATRNPTTADVGFRVPTIWINRSSLDSFLLISTDGGVATWISLGEAIGIRAVDDFYDASTAVPGAPSIGDAYILDESTPVDATWTAISATNDDIVQYANSGWLVHTPYVGQIIWIVGEDDFYIYNGSSTWELLSTAIGGLTYVTFARAPLTSDNSYVVPTLWVNSVLKEVWILSGITAGVARWIKLGGNTLGDAQDSVLSIADGNAAPPTEVTLNRYIITDGGGGSVHADWDGASFNDLVEFDGANWVATSAAEGMFTSVQDEATVYIFITSWEKLFQYTGISFGTDSGTATPDILGVANILGTSVQGLSFSGATNTVTGTIADATSAQKGVAKFVVADFSLSSGEASLVDTVVKSVTTDSGAMTPAGHSFSILGGAGVSVTHTGAVATINIPGSGLAWTRISGTTQALAIGNGYVSANAALTTCTLPVYAVLGSTIKICGEGAAFFEIAQNAGQTIHFGVRSSTTGAGGSVTSTSARGCIALVCTVADTDWTVSSALGNFGIL